MAGGALASSPGVVDAVCGCEPRVLAADDSATAEIWRLKVQTCSEGGNGDAHGNHGHRRAHSQPPPPRLAAIKCFPKLRTMIPNRN
jgi:hypothetical protein